MTSSTTRPILTVPANLHFDDNIEDNSNENENENENKNEEDKYKDSNNEDNNVGYDIYLNENWDSGIGGGLWSTGAALAKYFTTSQHFLQQIKRIQNNCHRHRHRRRPLRVLELGSGNGFLSVCLVVAIAVATSNNDMNNNKNNNNKYEEENDVDVDTEDEDEDVENNNNDENWPGIEIVVTDTEEHLQLMKDTIDSNLKRILPQILERTLRTTSRTSPKILYDIKNIASVKEYLWGNKDYDFSSNNDMSTSDEEDNKSNNTSSNTNENNHFDLIIGSDVAYRDYLHEPLIEALKEFSNSSDTISLIGITMNDTKPIFFNKLIKAGFQYEKLAEHLFDNEYNTCSRQFGIFAITRTK
jgi:predicted nicotinamide N-methyase